MESSGRRNFSSDRITISSTAGVGPTMSVNSHSGEGDNHLPILDKGVSVGVSVGVTVLLLAVTAA